MKWWQVMTLDGVGLSIASTYPPLFRASSILRRPHHEIHFDAIAEAEYHPRFQLRYWRTNFYNFEFIVLREETKINIVSFIDCQQKKVS